MRNILLGAVFFAFFACTSKEAPIITSASYQHTQYNGQPQAVQVTAAKEDAPFIVTYFRTESDLEQNQSGTKEAPSLVGDYYVKVERPAGKGYRQGRAVKIEYHIQKAFIALNAESVQHFVYDGYPKEVVVNVEPKFDIIVSYYDASDPARALVYPPQERGRYIASLVFPGNEQYMGASKEITVLIE